MNETDVEQVDLDAIGRDEETRETEKDELVRKLHQQYHTLREAAEQAKVLTQEKEEWEEAKVVLNQELEEVTKEKEETGQELAEIKEEIGEDPVAVYSGTKADKEATEEEKAGLEEKLEELTTQVEGQTTEISGYKTKVRDLEEEKGQLEGSVSSLKESNKALQEEVATETTATAAHRKRLDKLRELEGELEELRLKEGQLKRELAVETEDKKAAESERDQFKTKYLAEKEEKGEVESERDEWKDNYTTDTAEKDSRIETLKKELAGIENAIGDDPVAVYSGTKADKEAAEKAAEKAEANFEEFKRQVEDPQNFVRGETHKEVVGQKNARISELEQEIEDKYTPNSKVKSDYVFKKTHDEEVSKAKQASYESGKTDGEVAAKAEYDEQLAAFKDGVLKTKDNKIRELADLVKNAKVSLESKEAKIAERDEEIEDYKIQLAGKDKEIEDYEGRVSEKDGKIGELESELKENKGSLEAAQKTVEEQKGWIDLESEDYKDALAGAREDGYASGKTDGEAAAEAAYDKQLSALKDGDMAELQRNVDANQKKIKGLERALEDREKSLGILRDAVEITIMKYKPEGGSNE